MQHLSSPLLPLVLSSLMGGAVLRPPPVEGAPVRASESVDLLGVPEVLEPTLCEGNRLECEESFPWRGYCGGREPISIEHLPLPTNSRLRLYDQPGGNQLGWITPESGRPMRVDTEVVVALPERAYRVHSDQTCPVALDLCTVTHCKEAGEATLRKGDVIIPYLETPSRGYACSVAGADWLCDEEHHWLKQPSMSCFNDALYAITPVVAPETRPSLGWWIRVDQGWIRGDAQVELRVTCPKL